ncbi:MAG: OmpA/MotB domain protein [Bacteroidetes bacterium]|nr:OmpA/MotB domain protein [Bacteroidota bacterium]
MKKFIASLLIASGLSLLSLYELRAQQVNTLYFIENAPVRHYLNPAFQPLSNFYLGLPALGYSQFGVGNNSFTISSLSADKNKLYSSLRLNTMLNTDLQVNLLDFGFRVKDAYWTFALTQKVDAQVSMPKDLFKLLLFGTPEMENNIYNLGSLTVGANAYTEAALGYSRILNDKWTIGAKAKFLYGMANVSGTFDNFTLNAGIDSWTIKANGTLNGSSLAKVTVGDDLGSVDAEFDPEDTSVYTHPAGLGGAFDLGATFKPTEALTLAASVIDLGMIRWSRNVNNIGYNTDYAFTGMGSFDGSLFDNVDMEQIGDSLLDAFQNAVITNQSTKAYTSYLSPKLNLSAEYGILKNAITFGLLSRTLIKRKAIYEEITTSLNLRPANWMNMSFSYSLLNGKASNFGFGLGFRVLMLNAFVAADYLPTTYTKIRLSDLGLDNSESGSSDQITVPYRTNRVNLAIGFNLVFGNKQDEDKDGVSNRCDICPGTPLNVKVKKNGCPVDADGDNVPDYLDKCPDTPAEAIHSVDKQGCPLDTDKDGVPDYLDKCPDTPLGQAGKVDANGCPIDEDKDGVSDFEDHCPGTPEGVKVDENGCPFDEDGDGVSDFLDLCPGTPKAAKGMIDKNGCLLDTDNDSVPDYMDQCPDTPAAARGMVNEKGCPRDTDNDGIPDYLDNCPKIAGVAANQGCPEVKKEVRTLFQKALQGIQFETGKDLIKVSSYPILNQIAKVLLSNPTYLIEVQGHTDNVGKADLNKTLSEKRAIAVQKYLINKGVSSTRITAKGFGDTLPVAKNDTPANRAKNRRVEFVLSFEEIKYE